MIWGIINTDNTKQISKAAVNRMSALKDGAAGKPEIVHAGHIAIGGSALPHIQSKEFTPAANSDKTILAVFQGAVYNMEELLGLLNYQINQDSTAKALIHFYQNMGTDFIEKMNGKFSFAIIDKVQNKVILGRDRFGIEQMYYYTDSDTIVFSSTAKGIIESGIVKKELNYQALQQFLLYCYNPGLFSFYKNVNKLRPGYIMTFSDGDSRVEPYWHLSFATNSEIDESEVCETLVELMRDSVKLRVNPSAGSGVFLSGGMDSSSITAFLSESLEKKFHTFSFRCRGQSFDESHYAKIVADHYGTEHHLAEYSAEDVEDIMEIVKYMDEPFSDVGINIGTYILGKAAGSHVNCIYSGDGGDEVYGGHPVYIADKAAQIFNLIPSLLLRPFLRAGALLPDSEQKKNFTVKAKRFSESFQFPKELLSHRWRIYYDRNQLRNLIKDELWSEFESHDPYRVMLQYNAETDAKDMLGKSIYSDYQTVVGFYLRRMGLIRHFGIESRFPLLDHRLVEYAATLPSGVKIKGSSDTKYIFKKAMENILPYDIVYRKDKLGHSIPLKNWMRSHTKVKQFIMDLLSEENIKSRGLFDHRFIQGMIDEHMSMKRNNSHRLWSLVVLELWMREND